MWSLQTTTTNNLCTGPTSACSALSSLFSFQYQTLLRKVNYQDNVYHATLRILAQGQVHDIDCRPSDALALAVQVNAPVFGTIELFYEDATFEATNLHQTVESIRPLAVN
ncbi:MAG: hypothetical protein EOO38_11250 [Cytophagaceae bacterium]|nr:MAG: hypothetical protein EOO38_11250 [Cytophagaceae bacterium]